MDEKFVRHLAIPGFGAEHQSALNASKVLVVGAGGLGSPVISYLAAAGVGTIGLVDDDVVERSNLHRQIIHAESFVGHPKVESVADYLSRFSPEVTLRTYRYRLDRKNAIGTIADYDLVIDGTDNFATRYLVNDACDMSGKPSVWGAVLRWGGHVSVFDPKQGFTYRSLFPTPPPPDLSPACAEGGVLGAVCGAVGSLMAAEAVKVLTGIGESLTGRMLTLDLRTGRLETLDLRGARAETAPRASLHGDEYRHGTGRGACSVGDETHIQVHEVLCDCAQLVVDVRADAEVADGMIPGAIHVPLDVLTEMGWRALPAGAWERVIVYCASGMRSEQALAVLDQDGHRDHPVVSLVGGYEAWRRSSATNMQGWGAR